MIKHTLQEMADFFGCYVAVDEDGDVYAFSTKPCESVFSNACAASESMFISSSLIYYDGDWRDSLTAPSEPPFKEGELVIYRKTGEPYRHGVDKLYNTNYSDYRRPTEEEWRILRGE